MIFSFYQPEFGRCKQTQILLLFRNAGRTRGAEYLHSWFRDWHRGHPSKAHLSSLPIACFAWPSQPLVEHVSTHNAPDKDEAVVKYGQAGFEEAREGREVMRSC